MMIIEELASWGCVCLYMYAFGVGLDILCSALSLRFYLTMEAWLQSPYLLLLSTFLVFSNQPRGLLH